MQKKILLIEPNYKNKYPPIGLMKLSTYHKMQNDKVTFFKGEVKNLSLELRFKECIKSLKKIDKNSSFTNKTEMINSYLSTKKIKILDQIVSSINPNKRKEIEKCLRFYSTHIPVDQFDRIYITTLFTFYWNITIKTIQFAKALVKDYKNIYIGGVMASLLSDEIYQETQIRPFAGLLDKPGVLDEGNKSIIDELPLDYSILEEIDYKYPTESAYFTFMTKGCTRKCAFCSVPKLEPTYKNKIESIDKFTLVNERFGEQRNLLLMDNNVLASPKFPEIIEEIKAMGFFKGAIFHEPNQLDISIKNLKDGYNDFGYTKKVHNIIIQFRRRLNEQILKTFDEILKKHSLHDAKLITKGNILKAYKDLKDVYEKYRPKSSLVRYVDFNQGTDARYVTDDLMRLMSEIPIKPLRIAFDHIGIKATYINAVELAAKYGIKDLSNYILYNFHDKPEDFYERLRINVELGKRLNIKIFSFPMKYIPLFGEDAKHRRFIGKHWNRKFIRAIQSILNATKGIVAPGHDFFDMAFGSNLLEFEELLWMPEAYIINRLYFKQSGNTNHWKEDFNSLNEIEKSYAKSIIKQNVFSLTDQVTSNPKILKLLSHYLFLKNDKTFVDENVKRLRNKYNRIIKRNLFINLTLTQDFDSMAENKL